MGVGLPFAMGAALGCPDKLVCCVAGDGSLQMNIQELATCAEENIPVKIVVFRDHLLAMVHQWQDLFYEKRFSHVNLGKYPDFVKLAEAYGIAAVRLQDKTTLVEDLKSAFAVPGPVLIDVDIIPGEKVYPMIPPGAAARDMVG